MDGVYIYKALRIPSRVYIFVTNLRYFAETWYTQKLGEKLLVDNVKWAPLRQVTHVNSSNAPNLFQILLSYKYTISPELCLTNPTIICRI